MEPTVPTIRSSTVSYLTTGDPDSRIICGNNWATDSFTRTYIVSPQSNGSFDVTELFKGTFVTSAGFSPNDCSVQIAAGITGTMYGEYVLNVAAPADFNPYATCTTECDTSDFFSTFFNTSMFEQLCLGVLLHDSVERHVGQYGPHEFG